MNTTLIAHPATNPSTRQENVSILAKWTAITIWRIESISLIKTLRREKKKTIFQFRQPSFFEISFSNKVVFCHIVKLHGTNQLGPKRVSLWTHTEKLCNITAALIHYTFCEAATTTAEHNLQAEKEHFQSLLLETALCGKCLAKRT